MSRSAYVPLGGGLDLVTPTRKVAPGAALSCMNYECPVTGGYRRIDGYTQLGPVAPGQGPVLGVATFADRHYAIREDVGGGTATLYRLSQDETSWEAVGNGLAVGRYELDEGNVYATDTGRCLYGVGGGLPFELMAVPNGATTYADLQALVDDLYGSVPDDVTLSASADVLTVTDAQGRAISGIVVNDKAGTQLVTEADVPEATTEGDSTTVAIDLSAEDVNTIGEVRFTIGVLPETVLTIPELIGPFRVLDRAPPGASWIALHQNHLFLGFDVGSLQFSSIGDPATWNAATGGAGEIGVGQQLNGLIKGVGGVLHVLCRDAIKTLRGSSGLDFVLEVTVPGAGTRAYSGQSLMTPYFVGERGITTLEATRRYGDFAPLQAGRSVEPLFAAGGLADRVVASSVSREKAQYRVFFDNGTGLYMSSSGITQVEFPDQVAVTHAGEMSSGEEVLLFGDDQGYVHRLDGGQTFNGTPIRAFITLAYTDLKAPSTRKRFRRAFWDVRAGSDARMWIQPDFDYGDNQTGRPRRSPIDFLLGGGLWGVDNWSDFNWSVPTLGQEPLDVSGTGASINFAIFSESDSSPHELLGYDLQFDVRRNRRG
ncbi:MAG: hypothetical protein CME72_12365 [Halomonadaceae bacterium]|nr:hypothetical protein [Halomonadaceae bacterium]